MLAIFAFARDKNHYIEKDLISPDDRIIRGIFGRVFGLFSVISRFIMPRRFHWGSNRRKSGPPYKEDHRGSESFQTAPSNVQSSFS